VSRIRNASSVASVALLLVLTGCGSQNGQEETAVRPEATDNLWISVGTASLLHEASPPKDVEELASRSDLVVRGRILSIELGKEYASENGPSTKTLNATIEVSTPIKGEAPSQLVIQVLPTRGFDFDKFVRDVPTAEGVFYLQALTGDPSGTDFACTSTPLCVFSVDEAGAVVASRDEFRGAEWFAGNQPKSLDALVSLSLPS
jgi:hypothetical protein